MTARRTIAIAMGAITIILAAGSVASALPFGGGGTMMGPGMMGRGGYNAHCNPRAAGLAEWRTDRIERAIKLTDPQRAALNDLKSASTKAAEQISAACAPDIPARSNERLSFMEKRMEAMLQAIKTVRPAYDAFYASLSDQQKAQLDGFGPRRWGWRWWR